MRKAYKMEFYKNLQALESEFKKQLLTARKYGMRNRLFCLKRLCLK